MLHTHAYLLPGLNTTLLKYHTHAHTRTHTLHICTHAHTQHTLHIQYIIHNITIPTYLLFYSVSHFWTIREKHCRSKVGSIITVYQSLLMLVQSVLPSHHPLFFVVALSGYSWALVLLTMSSLVTWPLLPSQK